MYVLVHSLHLGTNLQKYQTLICPSHAPLMPWNVFMCHTYAQVSLQADLYLSIYMYSYGGYCQASSPGSLPSLFKFVYTSLFLSCLQLGRMVR